MQLKTSPASSRPVTAEILRSSIDLRLAVSCLSHPESCDSGTQGRSGSVVILDIKTGEILAMVNEPSYNPNDRSQYLAERYRNRAITDIFRTWFEYQATDHGGGA